MEHGCGLGLAVTPDTGGQLNPHFRHSYVLNTSIFKTLEKSTVIRVSVNYILNLFLLLVYNYVQEY